MTIDRVRDKAQDQGGLELTSGTVTSHPDPDYPKSDLAQSIHAIVQEAVGEINRMYAELQQHILQAAERAQIEEKCSNDP